MPFLLSIFFQKVKIREPFAKILKDIRKKLGKSKKTQEKTQNSRKKLKTQGKNSMSRRIAPLLTSQVMLKKSLDGPLEFGLLQNSLIKTD